MIKYYQTVDGRLEEQSDYSRGCWINVVDPDDEEVSELIEKYSVDPEYIRSSLDEEESSRIESEDGSTLIIMDMPVIDKQKTGGETVVYSTMPVGIIVTPDNVITVSIRDNSVIHEMADGMVKGVNPAFKTQFVFMLLLRMSARYLQYLKQMDKISSGLEKELRKSMRNRELIGLLDLEKSFVYFQTSLKSDESTLEKILRGRYLKLYEEDQELLEDVLVEVKQAVEMVGIYLSILSGTMDAFASVISNNLNIVMKVLTSITVLMAIPTMIFSFYGMNIGEEAGGLPFAGTIWIPCAVAAVITAVVAWFLYKKDMF